MGGLAPGKNSNSTNRKARNVLKERLSQATRTGWRRAAVMAVGVAAAIGLTAGAAVALAPDQTTGGASISSLTGHGAGRQVYFKVRTENAAWTGAAAAWTDVPGAAHSFSVASGTYRMFHAEFNAESLCTGSSGWCSVRILAHNTTTGAVTELNPADGTNYAFDAPGSASEWEGHALSRTSYYLPAGNYVVKAQAMRVGAGVSSFWLDDWNFAVTSYASS